MTNEWETVRVGSRLVVHLPEYRGKYGCIVLEKRAPSDFLCEYGNKDKAWLNLAVTKFEYDEEKLEVVPKCECGNDDKSDISEAMKERSGGGDEKDDNWESSGVESDEETPNTANGKHVDKQKSISKGDSQEGKNDSEGSNDMNHKKKTGNCEQLEQEEDVDSKNPKDEGQSVKSEETQPKGKKRKAIASRTRSPEKTNESKRVSIKVENDESQATPTPQSKDPDSKLVTPPIANRQKASTKSTEKANESDKDANNHEMHEKEEFLGVGGKNDGTSHVKSENKDGQRQLDEKKGAKQKVTHKKVGKKSATGRNIKKKASSASQRKRLTIKDVKAAHTKQATSKEDALLSAMIVYHMVGIKDLPFEKLVKDLGYKPKNKNLEQAWKTLQTQKFVEEKTSGKSKKRVFALTQKGIDKVAPQEYKKQLANPPKTTAELHERIRNSALNDHGIKIFDLLLEAREKKKPMLPTELASECGCSQGTHGFFYALKQLKNGGYAVPDPNEKRKLVLSDKCFLDG